MGQSSGTPKPAVSNRGIVWGIFLLLAAAALAAKFLFFSESDKEVRFVEGPKAAAEGAAQGLPRSAAGENLLLFGGALQKVQDFVPLSQDANYWTVFRDVALADPKSYENAPFVQDYKALLANPRHFRFLGSPVRIRGILSLWRGYRAEPNSAGVETIYRSWIFDGENGYVVDGAERPPVEEEGLKRAVVEASGIFYQIVRYETDETIHDKFRYAASLLRRARYDLALREFQNLLDQNPRPTLLARYLREVEPALWDEFAARGEDHAAAYRRLTAIGNQGVGEELASQPDQHIQVDAPFFFAKSMRLIGGAEQPSAFDAFFSTTGGAVLLLALLGALVGGFFFLFLKLQRSNDEKIRREREEFWREVRHNVKGITRPGGPRLGDGGRGPSED